MRISRAVFALAITLLIGSSGLAQNRSEDFGGQIDASQSTSADECPRIRICWREFKIGRTTEIEVQYPRAESEFVAEITNQLNESESCLGVSIWMETLETDILPTLAEMKNLESLTLVGSTFREGKLRQLRKCSMLKHVNFDGCMIGDDTCAELSEIRALETVQLTGAKITDRGLKHLSGIKTLRELDLRGTRISDEGLKSLQQNDALRLLDVRGTAVTPAGVQRLARALKNLRIHFLPNNRFHFQLVAR